MYSLPHAFLFSEGLCLVLSVVHRLKTIALHRFSSSVVVSGCSLSWSELKVHIDVKKLSPVQLVFLKTVEGYWASQVTQWERIHPQCRRHKRCRFYPWVGKMPWNGKWQPTLVFLPGKIQWERSLAGCSLWGCQELDMTEWQACTCRGAILVKFSEVVCQNDIPLLIFLYTYYLWNILS